MVNNLESVFGFLTLSVWGFFLTVVWKEPTESQVYVLVSRMRNLVDFEGPILNTNTHPKRRRRKVKTGKTTQSIFMFELS